MLISDLSTYGLSENYYSAVVHVSHDKSSVLYVAEHNMKSCMF